LVGVYSIKVYALNYRRQIGFIAGAYLANFKNSSAIVSSSILICVLFLTENNNNDYKAYSTLSKDCTADICEVPTVGDDDLKVELVSSGLKIPTTMAFLDDNDILF
jgi:hypothetical protein